MPLNLGSVRHVRALAAVATRARDAAAAWLALATRASKDAALEAMAERPARGRRPVLAANAEDVAAAGSAGTPDAPDRPAPARQVAGRGDGPGPARRRGAARPRRRGRPRVDAGQRTPAATGPGAVRRGRDHLRGPAQRHRRRRGHLPQERQRGAAAGLVQRAALQHRHRRHAAPGRRRVPGCPRTSSSSSPARATSRSRS